MDPVAGPVCITVLDGPSADPSRRLCRVLLWTREVQPRRLVNDKHYKESSQRKRSA